METLTSLAQVPSSRATLASAWCAAGISLVDLVAYIEYLRRLVANRK